MAVSYSWYKSSCLEVNCMVSHFVLWAASLIALFFCWSFSWGRSGRVLRWKRQWGRTHYSRVGPLCPCNGSREPFSPPHPRISKGSNAAHQIPASIQKEQFCSNKEMQQRRKTLSSVMKVAIFKRESAETFKKPVLIVNGTYSICFTLSVQQVLIKDKIALKCFPKLP